MKSRSIITIAGLTLTLVFFFVAVPMQAQCNLIPGSSVNNFSFDGIALTGKWEFSWNTVWNESYVYFQVRGGDISSVWLSVTNFNIDRSDGKTYLSADSLSSSPAGNIYRFRVSVEGEDAQGNCIRIDWKQITVVFQY